MTVTRAALEAQETVNQLRDQLDEKLLAGTATAEDLNAVQEAVAALAVLETAPLAIDCCERAGEWNALLDNARREAADLQTTLEKRNREFGELSQATTTLQVNYSSLHHQFECAQIDIINAQARVEMLLASKAVVEDELIATQERLGNATEDKRDAYIVVEGLNAQLSDALSRNKELSNFSQLQKQEIEESKSALVAANLTITELESQLANANALATQRREFAENVRKANEAFALDNQRLKARIEELESL